MLLIWSGADASSIKSVIGAVVEKFEIKHQVLKIGDSFPTTTAGDVILACGGKALTALQNASLAPKNRTIGSLRETPFNLGLAKCLMTYDPGIVSRDAAKLPDIQWDVALAIRLHNTRSLRPQVGKYRWVEDFNDLITRIEEKYGETNRPVEVSCDLETLGLDEFNPEAWIISISFTVDVGKSDLIYFKKGQMPKKALNPWDDVEVWEQIDWILTNEKVSIRGANFKYDSRWLNQKWGINCTNNKFDTILVGSLLNENRSNSLKLHAKIYTDMGGYEDDLDKYDKGRMDLVPKPELLEYAGGDTDATLQVSVVLKNELLKDKQLTNFYIKLMQPSSRAFEKMERGGICVDLPYYNYLQAELENEIAHLELQLFEMMPNKLKYKYADDLKITKHSLMKEFLFTPAGLNLKPKMLTEKTKEPSTAMDHLMMFQDDPVAKQFIALLKQHGSASKTLTTYVVGFLKHLRADGRFHPSYMLFRGGYGDGGMDSGAVTGRTSAKDPAVQTLPKHTIWTPKLRRAFIAPPGYTILQCDYSQGELKITACLANEPNMLKAYQNGEDLHAITAARLNGYTMAEFMALPEAMRDELRSGGKAGNFGLIYGMGAPGYRVYAFTSYGVSLSEEEAYNQHESFFELYAKLIEWHDDYRNRARNFGYVRSPLGRIRHLPLIDSKDKEMVSQAERQAINAPVQSCLSDMMQLAMVEIDRRYGDQDIQMFLMTHDSLALYTRIEDAKMWAGRICEVMATLPLKKDFGWDHQLQFTADAEIAIPDAQGVISLASLTKLKNIK